MYTQWRPLCGLLVPGTWYSSMRLYVLSQNQECRQLLSKCTLTTWIKRHIFTQAFVCRLGGMNCSRREKQCLFCCWTSTTTLGTHGHSTSRQAKGTTVQILQESSDYSSWDDDAQWWSDRFYFVRVVELPLLVHALEYHCRQKLITIRLWLRKFLRVFYTTVKLPYERYSCAGLLSALITSTTASTMSQLSLCIKQIIERGAVLYRIIPYYTTW